MYKVPPTTAFRFERDALKVDFIYIYRETASKKGVFRVLAVLGGSKGLFLSPQKGPFLVKRG